MGGERRDLVTWVGYLCFGLWFVDFINIIFFVQKPVYLLWFSTAGFFLTSIALIKRNPVLISTMFCALFLSELMWDIDFLGRIFFRRDVFGLTDYFWQPQFGLKDRIISTYHLIIPPALLLAVFQTKQVFRYSWVGAAFYSIILVVLTFLAGNRSEPVNCVYSLEQCRSAFSFVLKVPFPYHILTGMLFMTLTNFIPSNFFLLLLAKRLKWEII